MAAVGLIRQSFGMAEIKAKARVLGIEPGQMERTELIHAIQKAENNTVCFGSSGDQCIYTDCCFRADCLGMSGSTESSVASREIGFAAKVPWPVTIKDEWLEKGIMIIPPRLANRMAGTNTLHILYDQVDEVLPYEEQDRRIEGLDNFYSALALAEGDVVHLQLQALEPTRLFAYASWRIPLDGLVSTRSQDFDWQYSSLRDCIVVTLAKLKSSATCQDIQMEISAHKAVPLSAVIKTLSRCCPEVFENVGGGVWQLVMSHNKLR